jgi:hypothetical protein
MQKESILRTENDGNKQKIKIIKIKKHDDKVFIAFRF